ncbi:DUF6616 family protein [Kaistia adipata]|uniref:DUF6616 family protein n=1 Tax=Kaistia adipata TaxID=166954 RepID=UPI00042762DA|nr:DUF6616 family protein [Kaistia adipata]
MHYLAELYTPRPAWLALDQSGRAAFFNTIGAGMTPLAAHGIEMLAFGETDRSKPHAATEPFFAIWRFPDEAALDALLAGIAATGWHDYFETRNAAGSATDLESHLAAMAAAS